MGKGIAAQYKQRYPDMFNEYKLACKNSLLYRGGDIWVYDYIDMYKPKKILCFATKVQWYYKSQIEWIERGLQLFIKNYKNWNITSIAWPKLGCNNGGLNWKEQVKPLMIKYLNDLDIINEIYE
jgi:O-acetyl-ADP-ribose deacetylase (regulator of RNase III)